MAMTYHEAFDLACGLQDRLEFDGAIKIFRAMLAQVPDPAVVRKLVLALEQAGRDDEAIAAARQYDDLMPGLAARVSDVISRLCEPRCVFTGAVVIPAYNAGAFVGEALQSASEAVSHLRALEPATRVAIVVVDDASSDDTAEACRMWLQQSGFADLLVVRHAVNSGAAAARNTGVRAASGDLLWFLDADDRFGRDHLVCGYRLLTLHPQAGYARTAMMFDACEDAVSRQMRWDNQMCSSITLCIRRSCHDFIGGFPEHAAYRKAGGEDVAYATLLRNTFIGAISQQRTAFYRRRPGNTLDMQMKSASGEDLPMSEELKAQQAVGQLLCHRRLSELRKRDALAALPPIWPRAQMPQFIDEHGAALARV